MKKTFTKTTVILFLLMFLGFGAFAQYSEDFESNPSGSWCLSCAPWCNPQFNSDGHIRQWGSPNLFSSCTGGIGIGSDGAMSGTYYLNTSASSNVYRQVIFPDMNIVNVGGPNVVEFDYLSTNTTGLLNNLNVRVDWDGDLTTWEATDTYVIPQADANAIHHYSLIINPPGTATTARVSVGFQLFNSSRIFMDNFYFDLYVAPLNMDDIADKLSDKHREDSPKFPIFVNGHKIAEYGAGLQQLFVVDRLGRTQQSIRPTETADLDFRGYNDGIYFIALQYDDKVETIKYAYLNR